MAKVVCSLKKSSTFAPQFRNERSETRVLGYGVIGNTTDSGPVILGSSPGIPTLSQTRCDGLAVRKIFQVLGYGVIGNTTDSGPVILGSSPGIPTQQKEVMLFCVTSFCVP